MPKTFSAPVASALPPEQGAPAAPPARRKIRARAGSGKINRRKTLPEPPVVLTYLPGRVAVIASRVIPSLVQQPLVPGAGGVRQLKDGSWDFRGLRDDDEQRGGIFLDPSALGYIEELEGGELVNTWASPKSYADLVEGLITEEVIPPPSVDDVRAFVEQQRQILERITKDQHTPGNHAGEIPRHLEIAEEWLKAHGEAA